MPEGTHAEPTHRELDILLLLMDEQDLVEIATRLYISLHTARSHVAHLRLKTGVHSLSQLTAWGFKHRECCCGSRGRLFAKAG